MRTAGLIQFSELVDIRTGKDTLMKIPGINGIKKTINANQRSKTIQAEYRQKYADYVAFAEQVQQDINELGEVRIAALRALDEAVKLTGPSGRPWSWRKPRPAQRVCRSRAAKRTACVIRLWTFSWNVGCRCDNYGLERMA